MKRFLIVFLSLSIMGSISMAKTVIVPGDAPTISGGIAEVEDLDTVLVMPGTYYENLDISGRTIVVMSEAGPDLTIIRPADSSLPIVNIDNPETRQTFFPEIIGFTFTGSSVMHTIYVGGTSEPLIADNIFYDNIGEFVYDKGVITCYGEFSAPLIERNIFYDNKGVCCVWVVEGFAQVYNNTLTGNRTGILSGGNPTVLNNIIASSIGTGMDGTFLLNDYNNVWGNAIDYG